MLEDRDYMRQPEYRPGWRWSATNALLVAFAAVFIAEIIASPIPRLLIPGNQFCYNYFALSLEGIKHGRIWQLLTYQFMHGGLWHIVGNSLVIFFFGREMESLLGWKRYLTLFFSSGILGGVFQIAAALLWPQFFDGPVVGASAGAFGLIAAFAAMYPDRELTLLIFFVIPVRMQARTLLVISGVVAVLGIVFSESILGGHVAHAAHLGGMFMGVFYVRQVLQGRWFQFRNPLRRQSEPSAYVAARAGREKSWRGSDPAGVEVPKDQFIKTEVDPILDKISAHGIQSLTARERQILEKARAKMGKK
jgi:membrane associated rhomboid family serine protease